MSAEDVTYDKLGELVVVLVPDDARRVLLYAELDDGMVAPSLYYELNGDLRAVEPDDALFDELFRIQEFLGSEVRALEFELDGDTFQTRFTYEDDFDEASSKPDRTQKVLLARFGRGTRRS